MRVSLYSSAALLGATTSVSAAAIPSGNLGDLTGGLEDLAGDITGEVTETLQNVSKWVPSLGLDDLAPALGLHLFKNPFVRPMTLDEILNKGNSTPATDDDDDDSLWQAWGRLRPSHPSTQTSSSQTSQTSPQASSQSSQASSQEAQTASVESVDDSEMTATTEDATTTSTTSSTCTSPTVRVEWDNMSNSDRQNFIDAVKCLMNSEPSGDFTGSTNRFEDLAAVHQMYTPNVHGNAKFLVWHRYFLWTFEQLLRDECGMTGPLPWFDETRYAGQFAKSSLFSSDWLGGIALNGGCVTDGVSLIFFFFLYPPYLFPSP